MIYANGGAMIGRAALLFGILSLCGACAEQGEGPVLSSGDRYVAAEALTADYRLGTGDKVKVSVYNEPGLSGEYWINPDGTLSLPLIGSVPARDKPVAEVAAEARARLADGYLREPIVAMEVVAFRPFYIMGEVAAPGQYPYASGMTAMNAVALARGFTPRANRAVVRIRGEGTAAEVNYRLTPELIVRPGDTLHIGERFF
ncbi:polysaccharide biosynthesis/export family protein [Sphingomonas olei]|nr:polysaccharide biosynthesis/export family protein [Sphingomonas olei]